MAWKIHALLAAVFAALSAILAKAGLKDVDANLATAVRVTVILFIAWGAAWASGGWEAAKSLSFRSVIPLVLSACATGASWLFYFKALQEGPTGKVAGVDKLSLVLTLVLAAWLLGEPIDAKTAVGGALITIGALALVW